jgi:hypothetical protein
MLAGHARMRPGKMAVMRELRIVSAGLAPELIARLSQAVGIDERSEETGGGDPSGSAGGAGGGAPRGIDTLEDVLRFGFTQRPAWELAEVIVQDEFTHDVIIEGPAPAFLVFDTT